MLHRVLPNFEAEDSAISFVANMGYVLALNVKNLTPQFYHTTFPEGWAEFYTANRYALIDPILIWASFNTGMKRWSEISLLRTLAINDRVMKKATEFDLNYGVILCQRMEGAGNQKSFFSAARSDREFTDKEIEFLSIRFKNIIQQLQIPPLLSDRENLILTRCAEGFTQEEIAREIKVSRETIKKSLEHVRRVLGAKNATQAVSIALSQGLISPSR